MVSMAAWATAAVVACCVTSVSGQERLDAPVLVFEDDIAPAQDCHARTMGHLDSMVPGAFAQSEYFDCFRPQDQVFAYLDAMAAKTVEATAHRVTIATFPITTTVYDRVVPAYKLSTTTNSTKKSIYFQSGMHAREWISITSTVFTWASLVDAAVATTARSAMAKLLDKYDVVYVPIVNLDGYMHTWSSPTHRYHRKNMQFRSYDPLNNETNMTAGVDLNRNFGPTDDDNEDSLVYSGLYPFSEPEVQGIRAFVDSTQSATNGAELAGVLDIHSYGGLILTPFGNSSTAPDHPFDVAFYKVGQDVQSALRRVDGGNYTAMQAFDLYFAQGMFCDYVFATYHLPTLVIEIEGTDFRAPPASIRTRGREIAAAVVAFAQSLDGWAADTKRVARPGNKAGLSSLAVPCYQTKLWSWCLGFLIVRGIGW
ncbi:hypothetical protein H310_08721 [Aphanomyces invadans]|uniref:Peptidase M14 domain-containing protein n=1 Tax=Aphanomyces invadans TaxID=157072 RepID=A0A024TX52_9STRA|nr:hypothetical protein H310_08721 [Aphanomyces invadans]ETV98603.1 hypothetical protein H310_08721 [Aphanomyces invadans]|eukprot:XP_008872800.1 hypothetical protein H310_08721 [Aphanomyces invadans]